MNDAGRAGAIEDPKLVARGYRAIRNAFAAAAVGVQVVGLASGILFLLTVPASFFLVCGAAIGEWLASRAAPDRSATRTITNVVLVLALVGAAALGAEQAASWGCTELGHDLKPFRM